ncbi:MAG: hypothetical protein OEY07_07580, partial [Gammaproteobacteria bacterium]|nr:hypothetical protein [Gammaproteobacteria bacterium]
HPVNTLFSVDDVLFNAKSTPNQALSHAIVSLEKFNGISAAGRYIPRGSDSAYHPCFVVDLW